MTTSPAHPPATALDAERARRLVVVLNPAAGSGRAARVWAALVASEPTLAGVRLVAEAHPAAASAALAAALADPAIERCLAVGGDGTLHWVVNRLLADGDAARVAVGLVPAGTGSDFARGLGLPRKPAAALLHAATAPARALDALCVEPHTGEAPRFVVNIASAGLSGLVDSKVNALRRRNTFTFLAATLSALGEYTPRQLVVRVDGELLYAGRSFLVAIANGRYFGKGMKVAPHAVVDDGLAEVVVVGDLAQWQLPMRLPRLYLGTHLGHPQVHYRRGGVVELEPAEALPPFDVDGEVMPSGPASIRVLPGALRFVG
jgi:diacylglycerol kinase (ATP)